MNKYISKSIAGLYLIERIKDINDNNPIFYIGQAKNIFKRMQDHYSSPTGQEIDRAINQYGLDSFTFRILKIENSQKERNRLEKEFIANYILKYNVDKLYNQADGGKNNQKLINQNREIINKDIIFQIRDIFKKDIDYPIYLICERFKLHHQDVINIRKPCLKEVGMVYDFFKKRCVYIKTRDFPKIWRAGFITIAQFKLYNEFKDILERDQLLEKLNISLSDLKEFEKTYSDKYTFADNLI